MKIVNSYAYLPNRPHRPYLPPYLGGVNGVNRLGFLAGWDGVVGWDKYLFNSIINK
jgi:hypothetical protein